jgi:hypothetical protein
MIWSERAGGHNPWTEVTLWNGQERIQLAQLNISGGRQSGTVFDETYHEGCFVNGVI